MQKIIISVFFLCFLGLSVFSQVPGRRSKIPFTAIDGHTYFVGDTIKFGWPSDFSNKFSDFGKFVYVYTPANIFLDRAKKYYDLKLSRYMVIIEHFSIVAHTSTVYAVFTHVPTYPHEKYNPSVKSVIVFNNALNVGEIQSKNPAFIPNASNISVPY